MTLLFKNARILKMDDTPLFFGDLVTKDKKIVYIGSDSTPFGPFDRVIECDGNVLMPTFKNAHAHTAMTFVRSKTDDASLQDWLFNCIFPREALLKAEDIYHLSKVAILEYISGGISASYDMYFYPTQLIKASEEMGFRSVIVGMLNSYTNVDAVLDFIEQYDSSDGLTRYYPGVHSEYTVGMEEFNLMQDIVETSGAPFSLHICETEREVQECKERRNGLSPVQFIDSLGLFQNGGACYHCNYLTDEDIETFKRNNVSVVTCPGSNTKLASGIAPIEKYIKAGLNVALGTDGPASNNCLDMFKEMSLVTSLQKVSLKDPKALPAETVLKMATVNGAKAMGLKDVDILEVGKYADLLLIDLKKPNMQPLNNIINNIVYAGNKTNVKMTVTNGKIVYEDGKFNISEDIKDIYRKCQEVTDRLERELREGK